MYELDYIIRVNPNSSESGQNLEKPKETNIWRLVQRSCVFFWRVVWMKLIRVNLGGSETDQSVCGARHMLL